MYTSYINNINMLYSKYGVERRDSNFPVRVNTIDFESTALDHSATSPRQMENFGTASKDVKILNRTKLQAFSFDQQWSLQSTVHEF